VRLAVIGGGSTYTPELVSGLAAETDQLPVAELVLQDVDVDRLAVVGGVAGRILRRQEWSGALTLSGSLAEAVEGADAVIVQLRVGGQAARLRDETVPLGYGAIGQETTGAGGLAKALRTVPVVLDVAAEVARRAAPGAWIVDFTNPVGIVTRALLDAGHRAVGLCNVAIGLQRYCAELLTVAPSRVDIDQVGLNHLTWVRAVRLDGIDVLPMLIGAHGPALAARLDIPLDLIVELGALPSYYLRYFYAHSEVLAEQRSGTPRAATVAAIEADLLEQYRDPELASKPALLAHRGGAYYSEAAIGLLASMAADTGDTQVVDLRNAGTLYGLDDDDVVEVPARIDRAGAHPLPQPPLDPVILGLVQQVAAYERLAVGAALSGSLRDVRRALLAHPLIGEWEQAKGLAQALRGAEAAAAEPADPAPADSAAAASL
jgi:6-phospho-beta-glucosidase